MASIKEHQMSTDRKGKASCLGTSSLLLVKGELDIVKGAVSVLLLLGSIVDCSGRSGKAIKEIKQV